MEISPKRILRLRTRFDFDLFGERHAVGFQLHLLQNGAAEDPHAGLRIAHPAEEERRKGDGEHQVAEFVLETHGAAVAHGEPRSVEEIDVEVKEGFDQIRERVGRIAVVAIERDDQVAHGDGESAFIAAAVAAHVFADDFGAAARLRRPRSGRWRHCPQR